MPSIYKIVSAAQWREGEVAGSFRCAPIDLADGFIHFSTWEQVAETAAKHFAGQSDLLLVRVDTERLGEKLKWEVARGGELFPHLYAELSLTDVVATEPLPLGKDGKHRFPQLVP